MGRDLGITTIQVRDLYSALQSVLMHIILLFKLILISTNNKKNFLSSLKQFVLALGSQPETQNIKNI